MTETFLGKGLRFQRDHSVYLVRQPLKVHGYKMRVLPKVMLSKGKDLKSTCLHKVELENIGNSGGKGNVGHQNMVDKVPPIERDHSVKENMR